MNRTIIATLAAAAVAGTLLAAAPAAHAEDHRPCVSMREYHGTHLAPDITLGELEDRWDVRGHGKLMTGDGYTVPVYQFRVCGYSLGDAKMFVETTDVDSYHETSMDAVVMSVSRLRLTESGPHAPH